MNVRFIGCQGICHFDRLTMPEEGDRSTTVGLAKEFYGGVFQLVCEN